MLFTKLVFLIVRLYFVSSGAEIYVVELSWTETSSTSDSTSPNDVGTGASSIPSTWASTLSK